MLGRCAARRPDARAGLLQRLVTMLAASAIAIGLFGVSAPAAQAGSVWDRVAACESSGRWSINNGNGFYGGLQFHPRTWAGFGGRTYASYAHRATKAQQIAIARRVLARQGPGAWPVCSKKAGLTRKSGRANANATASSSRSSASSPSRSTGRTVTRYVSARKTANVRSGPGTRYRLVGTLDRGDRLRGRLSNGWLRVSSGRYVSSYMLSSSPVQRASTSKRTTTPKSRSSSRKVTRYISARSSASVRTGPSSRYRVVGSQRRGTRVSGTLRNGWLRTSSYRWIGPAVLSTRPVSRSTSTRPSKSTKSSSRSSTVTRYVSARYSANVRSGPGAKYRTVDKERRGTRVRGRMVNGWLKIGTRKYIGSSVLSTRRV